MSDERESTEIFGSLPRSRPHRRSDKRTAASPANGRQAAAGKRSAAKTKRATPASTRPTGGRARARGDALRQPKQPGGAPPAPQSRRPRPPSGPEVVSTVVQAAVELAEIGLSVSTRAVRNALRRLPRP
jgi:hypothetical protein